VAVAALAAPATADACNASQRLGPVANERPGPAPLAVGDSVMLGAVPQLRRAGFEVNARGCRQMSHGLRLLARRRGAGSLPDVVVVALGHNWTITIDDIRRALLILGPERVLGMVTPRGEFASARAAIGAAGRRWPARVKVIPWAARSAGKPWTWDGLHLTQAGARAFGRLLSRAFDWPLP
jgi:lysophospholipase L1-like esterase